MRGLWPLLLVVPLGMVAQPGKAQEPLAVSSADMMAHVETSVPLVFPAMARAARQSGTVVVQVDVSTDGAVTGTKVISGPPMLIQAALDSVKQWTFKPFEKNGAPTPAEGKVSLAFTLTEPVTGSGPQSNPAPGSDTQTAEAQAEGTPVSTEEEETAKRYLEFWNACTQGMQAGEHDEQIALTCRQAADAAAEFAPDRRFVEKRLADVYAATALANAGNFVGALRYANRAVDVVKLGHDDAGGAGAAYSSRGMVEAVLDNSEGSDTDLMISENFERKAIVEAEKEQAVSLLPSYRQALARDLRIHASVLQKLNRPDEARAKLAEAAKF